MTRTDQFTVVDLFAGGGGLSTGMVWAIIDEYRDTIAAATGLGPDALSPLHPDVQAWLAKHVDLHAINHWEPAVRTHERNLPWATHYHRRIESLHPPDIVEPGTVNVLGAGPSCVHFSGARGGKPVSDQKRAPAWNVLTWIQQLRPDHLIIENVEEFRLWGPIADDGTPTKDGTIFDQWIRTLETLGYTIAYDDDGEPGYVLNAADYGDPQARKRLFILGARDGRPAKPTPTHAQDPDSESDREPWRPAADVIDWSDLGTSLWTRDIENARVTPPAKNTMARIAEGIRRHCTDRFAAFADAVETLSPDVLRERREYAVPLADAGTVAAAVDEPFFVRYGGGLQLTTPSVVKHYGTSTVQSPTAPLSTVTSSGNNHALSTPGTLLLGQQSNYIARDVCARPTPAVTTGGKHAYYTPETIVLRQGGGGVPARATDPTPTVQGGGAIGLATVAGRPLLKPRNGPNGDLHSNCPYPTSRPWHTITAQNSNRGHLLRPYLTPLYSERRGQRPRTHRVDVPLPTVTQSKSPAAISRPRAVLLDDFHGNSLPAPVDAPMKTVETKDRLALCVPELWPWGLDIKYRMLQPAELKRAQGFPDEYELATSTKRDKKKLIGNAVPVNTAAEIVGTLLTEKRPSLGTFGGGLPESDAEVPAYEEVVSDD